MASQCNKTNPEHGRWKDSLSIPSPFDLVFFNRMFSFIFSFVRKCSKLFFFFLTANVLTLIKLSLGKAFLASAWRLCVCRKHIACAVVWWVRACWGFCKEMNWFFKGQGWSWEQLKPWANLDFWKMGVIILRGRALIILLILCAV